MDITPSTPIITFASGDSCNVVSYKIVKKYGKEYMRLIMEVPEVVQERYSIRDKEKTQEGFMIRDYLRDTVIFLSNNPTDPTWFCLSNFDTTKGLVDVKGLAFVKDLINKSRVKDQTIQILENERDSYNEFMVKMSENVIKLKKITSPLHADEREIIHGMMKAFESKRGQVI